MYSFATSATEAKVSQEKESKCSTNHSLTQLCENYVRGYLDALQQLNQIEQNTNFSSFEERAYRTRLGSTLQANPLREILDVCLPSEINDSALSEILVSSNKELPLNVTVLKAIQSTYPC